MVLSPKPTHSKGELKAPDRKLPSASIEVDTFEGKTGA